MKTNLRRLILVGIVITSLAQLGCSPRGFAAFRTFAAFAAVATVLAVHDAHFHSHHCGTTGIALAVGLFEYGSGEGSSKCPFWEI